MPTGEEPAIAPADPKQLELPGTEDSTQTPVVPSSEPVAPVQDPKDAQNGYHRRQERRAWRQQLEAATHAPVTEDDVNAVVNLAKAKGYSLDDEDQKKQVTLIAEAAAMITDRRMRTTETGRSKVLNSASSANLAETLKEMGYVEGSEAFMTTGQLLFQRLGVTNPDIFADRERIEREIENITSLVTARKPNGDSVQRQLLKKAGAPAPSAPRTSTPASPNAVAEAKVKEFAASRGVSIEKAKILMENTKNLPSFAR